MPSVSPDYLGWHRALVGRGERQALNGHRSFILWFTGLSGAGKSTLAHAVERECYLRACRTFVLDGDNVRHGLCADLGFSAADRMENIRRVGEMSQLFVEAGVILLTAFISPFRDDRERVRSLFGQGDFIEIYCRCPVEVCEARDVKGLYQKARQGLINEFTGVSAPYEPPLSAELVVDTAELTLDESVVLVMDYLRDRGYFPESTQ